MSAQPSDGAMRAARALYPHFPEKAILAHAATIDRETAAPASVTESVDANPWHMLEELGNAVMHLHEMGGSGGTEAEDRVREALREAAKHVDIPIE